ncbi:MAG TPA: cyclic nucleotide-binding domain-containing protein [Chloroflexota bacterium]|nr:cyclic nucleotide-binding domain-containing protein [Chloroflexota bacterium]
MSAPDSTQQILATIPLLRHLNPRQIARLADLMVRHQYREGTTIVRQGDTSMSFYVVTEGRVRILRTPEDGREITLAEFGPGGFFGEMGLIDDVERAATVIALEPTECALLAKWDFQNALRDDPEIALALLPVLNQRIRELDDMLESLSPHPTREAVV